MSKVMLADLRKKVGAINQYLNFGPMLKQIKQADKEGLSLGIVGCKVHPLVGRFLFAGLPSKDGLSFIYHGQVLLLGPGEEAPTDKCFAVTSLNTHLSPLLSPGSGYELIIKGDEDALASLVMHLPSKHSTMLTANLYAQTMRCNIPDKEWFFNTIALSQFRPISSNEPLGYDYGPEYSRKMSKEDQMVWVTKKDFEIVKAVTCREAIKQFVIVGLIKSGKYNDLLVEFVKSLRDGRVKVKVVDTRSDFFGKKLAVKKENLKEHSAPSCSPVSNNT